MDRGLLTPNIRYLFLRSLKRKRGGEGRGGRRKKGEGGKRGKGRKNEKRKNTENPKVDQK